MTDDSTIRKQLTGWFRDWFDELEPGVTSAHDFALAFLASAPHERMIAEAKAGALKDAAVFFERRGTTSDHAQVAAILRTRARVYLDGAL